MRIAIATFAEMPPEFADDARLAAALAERGEEVDRVCWDDREADWDSYQLVVVRSTWDYTRRLDDFLSWADSIGDRLHNSPELIRWNADKHYLGDLAAAGIPVVETTYVEPGERAPDLAGEIVVKPTVSAGARDSGRFSPATHELAQALVAEIQGDGRTAMVQPYLHSVDDRGETAVVCFDGEPSHILRKGAILAPDEVAPIRGGELGTAAEVMYDPELVVAGEASGAELELARDILEWVTERFGYLPLYARVDMVPGGGGLPVLLELEAIEPNFYLDQAPGAVERIAGAIAGRAAGTAD